VRVGIVIFILTAAIVVNVAINTRFNAISDSFPFLGAAVWLAILGSTVLRQPNWSVLPGAAKGAVFLLSLVLCASMMPVEHLPGASWQTALRLGVSGLCRRFRRLDDLVRIVGRCGAQRHVPASPLGRAVAAAWLACACCLRLRLLPAAFCAGLSPRLDPQGRRKPCQAFHRPSNEMTST